MEIISVAQKNVLSVLGRAKASETGYRLLKYCASSSVNEGTLLFNLLTRELLFLNDEEWNARLDSEYLKERWFVVPENTDEKKYASAVRWVLENTAERPSAITSYTILTTTDCNARCFYCFEKGRSKISMSDETARQTARYIANHCKGKTVKLAWFGGEPLFNKRAIDIICEELTRLKIKYSSVMATNGYLFDEENVVKAKNLWNMDYVQITLDGTEEIYNRAKSFIYNETSAFRVVMKGIERLLDAKIAVVIRLNTDLYNSEDLIALVDYLAKRFEGKNGLSVYAQHLFEAETSMAEFRTESEWQKRYEAMQRLKEKISHNGLNIPRGIKKKLKLTSCMADSGDSLVIAPDGNIGLCEHYTDSEFIGHIDRDAFDEAAVKSWRERSAEIPECEDCVLYPECIKLRKCPVNSTCFRQDREDRVLKIQEGMQLEYCKKGNENSNIIESEALC